MTLIDACVRKSSSRTITIPIAISSFTAMHDNERPIVFSDVCGQSVVVPVSLLVGCVCFLFFFCRSVGVTVRFFTCVMADE